MKPKLERQKKNLYPIIVKGLEKTKDIINIIPNKEDTKLSIFAKTIAILGMFLPRKDPKLSLIESGFKRAKNEQFVYLFSGLCLDSEFDVDTNENKEGYFDDVLFYNPDIGTLLFLASPYKGIKYDAVFFHSPDFDFDRLAEVAWEKCNGHMLADAMYNNESWSFKFTYSKFDPIVGTQYGSSKEIVRDFVKKHIQFKEKNKDTARCYLFLGPPGTGKSTTAQTFATQNHKRILRVSSDTLYRTRQTDFVQLLDFIEPQCLMVDEIDKSSGLFTVSDYSSNGNILTLLDVVKDKFPEINILFTANSVDPLPEALIRRIDDIIELEKPNAQDRKEILKGYLNGHGSDEELISFLVKESNGLSPSHLKEISKRISAGQADGIEKVIKKMIKYIKIKNGVEDKEVTKKSGTKQKASTATEDAPV